MTLITETVLYVALPSLTLLLLSFLIPVVIGNLTTEAKEQAADAEHEFLERIDLTMEERKRFIDAKSKNERLEVVANVAKMRGVYAPIPIPGFSYQKNIREFTRMIIETKKGRRK